MKCETIKSKRTDTHLDWNYFGRRNVKFCNYINGPVDEKD